MSNFDYDQFDRNMAHYESVRKELGLDARWSIFEIENLSVTHPFETAKTVSYKSHVTNKTIVKPIIGGTFAALYMAANACIRESLDEHHVFIEAFRQNGDTLELTTGS